MCHKTDPEGHSEIPDGAVTVTAIGTCLKLVIAQSNLLGDQ
jgi:hypothetical protein